MERERVGLIEKLSLAVSNLFGGGGPALVNVLFLIFLTNVVKIDPGWAGAIVLVARIWDAVSDPMMGVISDNTRGRFGRRKPYLVLGGVLVVVALSLIWLPLHFDSQAARIAYALLTYLFFNTVATIISVPFLSLCSEISTDPEERSKINVFVTFFSLFGGAVCTMIPSMLFEQYAEGKIGIWIFYLIIVAGFGTMFAVPQILAGILVKERVPYPKEKTRISIPQFLAPLKIISFRKLLIMFLSSVIAQDVAAAVILYYSLYVIPQMQTIVFLGIFLGVQILLLPVIHQLVSKISGARIFGIGLPLTMLFSIAFAFYQTDWPIVGIYVITAVMAVGYAGAQTMVWVLFPDVVDVSELGLKNRNAGSFSALMTFTKKTSSAFGVLLIGVILQVTGYIAPTDAVPMPDQPGAVIMGIRLTFIVGFVLILSIAWIVSKRLKLSYAILERINYFNEKQRNGELANLSGEERSEYHALMKEFVYEVKEE